MHQRQEFGARGEDVISRARSLAKHLHRVHVTEGLAKKRVDDVSRIVTPAEYGRVASVRKAPDLALLDRVYNHERPLVTLREEDLSAALRA
jgi:hypothetical protein